MTAPRGPNGSRSDSVLRAVVAVGVLTVAGVEILSLFGWLGVGTAAVLGLTGLGVLAVRLRGLGPWLERGEATTMVAVVVAAVAGLTLIVAIAGAPNTWDSMTYHLARVEQWLTRGSVRHYPTAIDRQVWQPPLAEYLAMVAAGLVGGGDRLANLVQWVASLGAAGAAARMIGVLGGSRRAAWTGAALVLTIPPVILQATSTQNDLTAAMWVATAAGFALSAFGPGAGRALPLWFGASLGLAVATKGTALVFGLPWLAVLGGGIRGHRSTGAALRAMLGAGVVALLLNGPWLARNVATFGSPLGDQETQRLLRPPSLAPAVLLSNLVANASLHWGTPIPEANRVGGEVLLAVNRVLGVDLAATYPYFGGLRIVPWSTDEDLAGAPLVFLLGLAAIATSVVRRREIGAAERWYLVGWIGSMVLCGVLVRWQPFSARLQLPGLVLAVPLIALAVHRWGERWARVVVAVAFLIAMPPLVRNLTRPLIGTGSVLSTPRSAQYFARRPEELDHYRALVERLDAEKCAAVGLKTGYDSWEYPLWALARSSATATRFEQVLVVNATASLGEPDRAYCALVGIDQPADWSPNGRFEGWRPAGRMGRLGLWLPGPTTR